MATKRWEKGESGNPNGRPRNLFSIKRALDVKMSDINPKDKIHGRTYGQCLIDKAFDIALRGRMSNMQVRAIEQILDRALGKPVQAVAVADMRPESREQMINSILEHTRAEKDETENDGSTTIQ